MVLDGRPVTRQPPHSAVFKNTTNIYNLKPSPAFAFVIAFLHFIPSVFKCTMARRSKSYLALPVFTYSSRKRHTLSPKKKKQKKSALKTEMNPFGQLPDLFYEVEVILAVRATPGTGPAKGGPFHVTEFEYLTEWRGNWGRLKRTWEPEASFKHAARLLESFKEEMGITIGVTGTDEWSAAPSPFWIYREKEIFWKKYEHMDGDGMYGWLTTDETSKLDKGELFKPTQNHMFKYHNTNGWNIKWTLDHSGKAIVKKFVKIQ